jgi:hypothetical protein
VIVAKGRKSKRTPETEGKLIDGLRQGMTVGAACAYAGITYDTFYVWCNEFPEFSESVARAEDEAEAFYTEIIAKSARERLVTKTKTKTLPDGTEIVEKMEGYEFNPDSAKWWLERRRSQHYANTQKVQFLVDQRFSDVLTYIRDKISSGALEEVTRAYEQYTSEADIHTQLPN